MDVLLHQSKLMNYATYRIRSNQNHLIKYLKTQSDIIAHLGPIVSRRSTGKPVHELRVATRRARAAIWVMRKSSNHIHLKKINRNLRKLGNSLGRIRELDVAIIDASHFKINSSKLKTQRELAKKILKKQVNHEKSVNLSKQFSKLEKIIVNVDPISILKACNNLHTLLNRELNRHIHGQTKLHHLRILMKKTRYALESMGKPVEKIKRLQDILGDAHDLEMLQELVGKNIQIKSEQLLLNTKATYLVKPALRYAMAQLIQ